MYHVNTNWNKVGVAVLISERVDFRARKIIRDKEGHYLMIKGSILQEDITIFNMYIPITEYQNTSHKKW